MNFCGKCGAPLAPGTSVCMVCGPTAQAAAAPAPAWQPPPPAPVPSWQAPAPPAALPMNAAEASGFLSALFDLSFTSFITTKLIKVLYILGMIGAGCWALVMAAGGITQGGIGYLLVLAAPLLFLLGVIYFRVMMEVIMVVFRGAEHLAEIARQGRR